MPGRQSRKNTKKNRELARRYLTIKALKDHFNLHWGDVDKILLDWKHAHPKYIEEYAALNDESAKLDDNDR